MSVPIKDTAQRAPLRNDAAEAPEGNALHEIHRRVHDTNAVFNVLDALEAPAGRQRLLRSGMMILSGAFFLVALALLASRYTDEIREQSKAAIQRISANEPMETTPDRQGSEMVSDAWPDAVVFTAADATMRRSSADEVLVPLETVSLSDEAIQSLDSVGKPVEHSAFSAAAEGGSAVMPPHVRKPRQETAPQASRRNGSSVTKTQVKSRVRERHARTDQTGPRANRMLAKGKAPAPDKIRRKDTDVDLIAALLSKAPQKPSLAKGSHKASQGGASAETRPPELHAALGGSAGSPDVVIRTQSDTTDSLVKRCGTLGLIESHLCRARICSGLWGKDAACPASNTAAIQ